MSITKEHIQTHQKKINDCLVKDRHRLNRVSRDLLKLLGKQQSVEDEKALQRFEKFTADIEKSQAVVQLKKSQVPKVEYPESLPVSQRKDDIAKAIQEHQVVVIAGETGSGKTTQLPKICLELGRGLTGKIGHTQPRRLAARSVANRIAEELHTPLGEAVGFQVRFSDQSSPQTYIKLMTDGILLAETRHDRYLNQYDTIIIDEAHERSLNIDFLLGYLKNLLPKRPDLKIIITSATIDVEKFSKHFNNAPVIEVSGRSFPVEVYYRPSEEGETDLDAEIVDAVEEIIATEPPGVSRDGGDILVFLSGERDIREAALALRKANIRDLEVVPLYARLSNAEQTKIFQSHRGRRVVLATNVAETSLTVPGISYVIDPGYARISRYSYRTKVQRLPIEAVSQASANQRKGRCGRVSEGICVRLYSEEDFLSRPEFTDAEILRTNLASVILQMLSLNIGEVERFPFIDPPDRRLINDGYKLLQELGAVTPSGKINKLGKQLSQLPVDPRLAKMVVTGHRLGCLEELLIIVSGLSVQDPRERPADKQQASDEKHRVYRDDRSDFIGMLNLWNSYELKRQELSQNHLRKYCKKHFLSYMRMREWRDVHHQLKVSIKDLGFTLPKNTENLKKNNVPKKPVKPSKAELKKNSNPKAKQKGKQKDVNEAQPEKVDYASIHQALLSGLLGNVGCKQQDQEYLGARNRKFFIFPGSAQFKKQPKWLVAGELVETTKLYARSVASIDPSWLLSLADHLVKRSYYEPHWSKKAGQVMAYERVSLYGLVIEDKRRVSYGSIDPIVSREIFIRSALVERQSNSRAKFLEINQKTIDDIEELESKSRTRNIMVDEQVLFDFYSEKIPEDIVNVAGFESWRKKAEEQNPKLLCIDRERLMLRGAADVTEAQFPSTMTWQGITLGLSYEFNPGSQDDGVSVNVPVAALNQMPEYLFDWLVPGLLREKCIALLKSLPKAIRKQYVPVPETVDKILSRLKADDVPLVNALTQELKRLRPVNITKDDWQEQNIDDYYRMNFRILDEKGKCLQNSRDLPSLKDLYRDELNTTFQKAGGSEFEQDGLTDWQFSELPPSIEFEQLGITMKAYPALEDRAESVSLVLVDNADEAAWLTDRGLVRLLSLRLSQQTKYLRKNLLKDKNAMLYCTLVGGRDRVIEDLVLGAIRVTFLQGGSIPRTHSEFEACIDKYKADLTAQAQKLEGYLVDALKIYHEINRQMKGSSSLASAFAFGDIKAQLAALFGDRFIYFSALSALQHYPRYMKAIAIRLEKLSGQAQKDKVSTKLIAEYWSALEAALSKEGERLFSHPECEKYRWMIEELRVSLFAQQLGTSEPVSEKRLKKQWQLVSSG